MLDRMPAQPGRPSSAPTLLALSDLHVGYRENRALLDGLRPRSERDWLLVPGDVAERFADVEWALRTLTERFTRVIWAPGNHELWTHGRDEVRLRGLARYQALVGLCRDLGVITPEDPYPVWDGPGGPARLVPTFLLYDYSWRPEGARSQEEALEMAYNTGVVCSDERLLHPDPWPSREAWCWSRIDETEQRLASLGTDLPLIFVNHFPLVREPTRVLRYPPFAQWCGTDRTHDWHRKYHAAAVVYGHLHIPRTTWYDGVRFEEVSTGYPREWRRRDAQPGVPRQILPAPVE